MYYVEEWKVINMKKIGIMLGVFNPPHNFHFTIANEILKNNSDIKKIIFVPANNAYNKPDIIDGEHRFNMLKLVCDKNPNLEVSRFEIDMEKQPYSEETLLYFQNLHPEYEINLIIGSDNIKTFNTWRNYPSILKNYSPIVFERDTDKINSIINDFDFLKPYKKYIKSSNCHISSDLSATKIRTLIRNKLPIDSYVPNEIKNYINDNKLYIHD